MGVNSSGKSKGRRAVEAVATTVGVVGAAAAARVGYKLVSSFVQGGARPPFGLGGGRQPWYAHDSRIEYSSETTPDGITHTVLSTPGAFRPTHSIAQALRGEGRAPFEPRPNSSSSSDYALSESSPKIMMQGKVPGRPSSLRELIPGLKDDEPVVLPISDGSYHGTVDHKRIMVLPNGLIMIEKFTPDGTTKRYVGRSLDEPPLLLQVWTFGEARGRGPNQPHEIRTSTFNFDNNSWSSGTTWDGQFTPDPRPEILPGGLTPW